MNRASRRHIERRLRKLYHTDTCSICGSPFRHNSQTVGGIDIQGTTVLAGECCFGKVAVTFTKGFYSKRQYDFLDAPDKARPGPKPTGGAEIAEAIARYQDVITETDKFVDDMMRRGGGMPLTPQFSMFDHPWKKDDRDWFERNPKRSHHMRLPFAGEADRQAAAAPAGHALILLVRQVEPGSRIKTGFYLNADLPPLPDDEATAHALFEVSAGREPMPPDGEAFDILIKKYTLEQKQ